MCREKKKKEVPRFQIINDEDDVDDDDDNDDDNDDDDDDDDDVVRDDGCGGDEFSGGGTGNEMINLTKNWTRRWRRIQHTDNKQDGQTL